MGSFWRVLMFVGVFQSWLVSSVADGKISVSEILELAETIARFFGLRLEWDVPGGGIPASWQSPEHKIGESHGPTRPAA